MSAQRVVLAQQLGGPEVLRIDTAAIPEPREERVRLEVAAVGVTPYDVKVLTGEAPREAPFPRGMCSDVAGIVTAVGDGARYADGTPVEVGDAVFGWGVNVLREQVVVKATSVALVPVNLPLDVAAGLVTPAIAADACVRTVPTTTSDIAIVSGASGSVGFLIAQLVRASGARVIGVASPSHHERLRAAGVAPVRYGDHYTSDLDAALAGDLPTALFDSTGATTISDALDRGLTASRIVTLAGNDVAERFGVAAAPTGTRTTAAILAVAEAVASGEVIFPVAASLPLDESATAFTRVASRHAGGKVVVAPQR